MTAVRGTERRGGPVGLPSRAMMMRLRTSLWAGLVGLAPIAGVVACAPAPASPASPTALLGKDAQAALEKPARRVVVVAKPEAVVRPPESESVIHELPDPEAQRLFAKRLAQPAVPLDSTTPRATELALADTARGQAPDMAPLGAIAGASLLEGQRAMMPVILAPGECATFIAEGGLGVIEVDLFLLLADRSAGVHVLAEDAGVGPIGVVGGGGHCYRSGRATPVAAELHVTVRRGAGVVLLRGYKK